MQAREQWRETSDKLRDRFPKLAALMDDAEDDVLAYMAFPKAHWPQLATTNPLVRLNQGDQATLAGDWHLPERRGGRPLGRRTARGADRRMAGDTALHESGDLDPGDQLGNGNTGPVGDETGRLSRGTEPRIYTT